MADVIRAGRKMELTKRQRNVISRATALAIGLLLAFACWRTIDGIRTLVAEQAEARAAGQRTTVPALLFFAVAVTGVPAALLIGFAIVPTRWLHAIDPSPSSVSGSDVASGGLRSLLH